MAAFDLLHPALQHHIVNSLGWREIRPFQEEVIPAVLQGEHVLIFAPTAGGKTEAAVLPVLSRMLGEDWRGLSTLYICPIKALLNNLHIRLERYASLVGRTCELWHGDIAASGRAKIKRSPPDILLTTPESLEVILVSTHSDPKAMLGQLQTVIVDELHAFAGDDRGWHLLAVLERASRLAGREIQRVGLSATIGNPDALLSWLTGRGQRSSRVIRPHPSAGQDADVQLDFVGSLQNAALVISRLHRGEKRLIFVDSRARAEELGAELSRLEVRTFVTHSSLSKEQRTLAEQAFAAERDCAIVATSVLELGIDVGDLGRVIQIDAPATVAGFLQRMGRTGRRAGGARNCLLLATHDFALLQAAAILNLWRAGYVEAVTPPPMPFHVLVQQLFALVLQEAGLTRSNWLHWLGDLTDRMGASRSQANEILSHCISIGLLFEDNGVLRLGDEGERRLGRRNFMELLSVITSQPLLQVRCGRMDIGFVHPLSFSSKDRADARTLSLGGRSWRVCHVDWERKIVEVEPSSDVGRSRWTGTSIPLAPELCQAIREVLKHDEEALGWSRRARNKVQDLRLSLSAISSDGTTMIQKDSGLEWWTFAGLAINETLAAILRESLGLWVRADNVWLRLPSELRIEDLSKIMNRIRDAAGKHIPLFDCQALDLLKFTDLLPPPLLEMLAAARFTDQAGARRILHLPLVVSQA